jgi:hypothetical protein
LSPERPGSTTLSLGAIEAETGTAGALGAGRKAKPAAMPAAAIATAPAIIQALRGPGARGAGESLVVVVILGFLLTCPA